MGTKVLNESYFPGFYSMRDLNENSSNSNWPLFCGDKIVSNGQYYNGFIPRTSVDGYSGYDKDTLKQKMLEHEAVFKNQVCELHHVYRIQRDMMEEARRKEIYYRASVEPASSSSHHGSQVPSEDAQKWHMAGFPLLNSSYGRTSIEGVENFSSPLSCTKGITTQASQSPFQNGSTSKDFEPSDSRPLKVRKKLFDLQLPADQYEDLEEEENLRDYKESDISSCTRDGNPNSGKLFIGSHVGKKSDRAMDVSASVSRLKGSTGLADLNDPIQIEEAMAPSSVDFLGRSSGNVHQLGKPTYGYLGLNGNNMLVHDGFSINSSSEGQVNDRGWLSHINRAGYSRGNHSSVTQGYQPDKLPLPSHPGKSTYPSGYGREGFRQDLDSSRSYNQSTNSHLETIASQTPSSYPFFSSSSFATSWAHPISSWAKTTNSFTPNVETSVNAAATMSRTLHSSAPSNGYFGGKWADSSSRPIPGFASESKSNGLSAGFDYLNCNRGDNVASNRSTNHGLGKIPKGSYADSKPVIDINLNETLIVQDLSTPDGKSRPEDDLRTLPWLKPKPVHIKEVSGTSRSELSRELSSFRSFSNQLCYQNETVRDLNQLFPSKVNLTSCHSEISRKKETTVQKILGVPIFQRDVAENEPSSHASTSVNIDCHSEGKIVNKERKKGIIDINVACEPDEQIVVEEENVVKEKQKNSATINCIDLNSCASDCEDPPVPFLKRNSATVIDLEVPVFMESEDDSTLSKEKMSDEILSNNEQIQDEAARNIAEALVSISSCPPQIGVEDSSICLPSEASVEEALVWFVNVVSSCKNDSSGKESRISVSDDEMDDFEAMTLQLAETREEDYMPTLFVPEIQETGGGNALATRSRRGHSRRGRQRRDFQRDILPGLTSLSRHEVTEDLQTFGGLMRATGHSWNSGLNRRNGTRNGVGRGRKRAVVETVPVPIPVCTPLIQQLNTIEGGLEDRSLTGWGKTTRRPRRQRCHAAGNPATVSLT